MRFTGFFTALALVDTCRSALYLHALVPVFGTSSDGTGREETGLR